MHEDVIYTSSPKLQPQSRKDLLKIKTQNVYFNLESAQSSAQISSRNAEQIIIFESKIYQTQDSRNQLQSVDENLNESEVIGPEMFNPFSRDSEIFNHSQQNITRAKDLNQENDESNKFSPLTQNIGDDLQSTVKKQNNYFEEIGVSDQLQTGDHFKDQRTFLNEDLTQFDTLGDDFFSQLKVDNANTVKNSFAPTSGSPLKNAISSDQMISQFHQEIESINRTKEIHHSASKPPRQGSRRGSAKLKRLQESVPQQKRIIQTGKIEVNQEDGNPFMDEDMEEKFENAAQFNDDQTENLESNYTSSNQKQIVIDDLQNDEFGESGNDQRIKQLQNELETNQNPSSKMNYYLVHPKNQRAKTMELNDHEQLRPSDSERNKQISNQLFGLIRQPKNLSSASQENGLFLEHTGFSGTSGSRDRSSIINMIQTPQNLMEINQRDRPLSLLEKAHLNSSNHQGSQIIEESKIRSQKDENSLVEQQVIHKKTQNIGHSIFNPGIKIAPSSTPLTPLMAGKQSTQSQNHQSSEAAKRALGSPVPTLDCDHLNTSHEELIEFQRPYLAEKRSPQAMSNNLLLPKFNFNIHHQTNQTNETQILSKERGQSVGLSDFDQESNNFSHSIRNYEYLQQRAQKLKDKSENLQKELSKCYVQKQIYSNQLKKRSFNDIQIEGSKLDLGLGRCFINRQVIQKYMVKEKLQEAELFYVIEISQPQLQPSVNDQDPNLGSQKITRFESDKIVMRGSGVGPSSLGGIQINSGQIIQWNQTFTVHLETGLEKILVRIFILSFMQGRVEIERQEISVDTLLPKLMSQRLKQLPYITKQECALEVMLRWRYDDTKQKYIEISKRIKKIKQMIDKYQKSANEVISENSPQVSQTKSNWDAQSSNYNFNQAIGDLQQNLKMYEEEYGDIAFGATPHFNKKQQQRDKSVGANRSEYSTTGQKRKVLARLSSSRSPSKYNSGKRSISNLSGNQSSSSRQGFSSRSLIKNVRKGKISGMQRQQHQRIPSFANSTDFDPAQNNGSPLTLDEYQYQQANQQSQKSNPYRSVIDSSKGQKDSVALNKNKNPSFFSRTPQIKTISSNMNQDEMEYDLGDEDDDETIENYEDDAREVQVQLYHDKIKQNQDLKGAMTLDELQNENAKDVNKNNMDNQKYFLTQEYGLANSNINAVQGFENDDFSTVQLDSDSPEGKKKAQEAKEYMQRTSKSKINKLQSLIDKKFEKIGNKTLKMPTRNQSDSGVPSLTARNLEKSEKDSLVSDLEQIKRKSILEIKERIMQTQKFRIANKSATPGKSDVVQSKLGPSSLTPHSNSLGLDQVAKQIPNLKHNQTVKVIRRFDEKQQQNLNQMSNDHTFSSQNQQSLVISDKFENSQANISQIISQSQISPIPQYAQMGNSSAASFSNSMNNSVSFAKFNPSYSSPPQNQNDIQTPKIKLTVPEQEISLNDTLEVRNQEEKSNQEKLNIAVKLDKKSKANTSHASQPSSGSHTSTSIQSQIKSSNKISLAATSSVVIHNKRPSNGYNSKGSGKSSQLSKFQEQYVHTFSNMNNQNKLKQNPKQNISSNIPKSHNNKIMPKEETKNLHKNKIHSNSPINPSLTQNLSQIQLAGMSKQPSKIGIQDQMSGDHSKSQALFPSIQAQVDSENIESQYETFNKIRAGLSPQEQKLSHRKISDIQSFKGIHPSEVASKLILQRTSQLSSDQKSLDNKSEINHFSSNHSTHTLVKRKESIKQQIMQSPSFATLQQSLSISNLSSNPTQINIHKQPSSTALQLTKKVSNFSLMDHNINNNSNSSLRSQNTISKASILSGLNQSSRNLGLKQDQNSSQNFERQQSRSQYLDQTQITAKFFNPELQFIGSTVVSQQKQSQSSMNQGANVKIENVAENEEARGHLKIVDKIQADSSLSNQRPITREDIRNLKRKKSMEQQSKIASQRASLNSSLETKRKVQGLTAKNETTDIKGHKKLLPSSTEAQIKVATKLSKTKKVVELKLYLPDNQSELKPANQKEPRVSLSSQASLQQKDEVKTERISLVNKQKSYQDHSQKPKSSSLSKNIETFFSKIF